MGPEFCGREHVVVATAMTQRQIEDGALAELSQIEDGHLRFVPLGVAEFRAATGEAGVEQHVDLGGRAGEIEFVLDPEIAQACGQRMIRPGDEDLERLDRRVRGKKAERKSTRLKYSQ